MAKKKEIKPINRILGVDPATCDSGFSIVDKLVNRYSLVHYGPIHIPSSRPLTRRLLDLYNSLKEIIDTYHPDGIVMEDQFKGPSVKTLKSLSFARGVIMLLAAQYDLPIFNVWPSSAKKAVYKGNATKEEVRDAVKLIFNIKEDIAKLDITDSIAIAYAFFVTRTQQEESSK
jgi:crossover junction endodeoxyribonuclease RuvC